MDLYERIEQTRFVGREFLVWIWWKSELFDGQMDLGELGLWEIWLDDQLVLEARGENVEQSRMKGGSPSSTAEAKEALRQGKVPTKTRLSFTQEEREFSCVLEGETFALSGVRLPTLLQDEREERFYERMYLVEELEEMTEVLFGEFLRVRLAPQWESTLAPAIRAWVREEPTMTGEEYLELLESLPALQERKRPARERPPVPSAPTAQLDPPAPSDEPELDARANS